MLAEPILIPPFEHRANIEIKGGPCRYGWLLERATLADYQTKRYLRV